jgi:hypothetical protein
MIYTMDANYNNQYNRSILAQYFRLAELQKNPKYVQQNWETDIIRNEPWGNYGEYRTVSTAHVGLPTHNYKKLSSGGNIAKHISQKKVFKQPIKLIEPVKKTTFLSSVSTAHVGQRPNVPKIIIPRPSVSDKTVSTAHVGLPTKPYINFTIADLEDKKKTKPKSGIQLLSRLL